MTNEILPKGGETKPEDKAGTRGDAVSKLTEKLNKAKRALEEQMASIKREKDKREEQLREMVEEVISMSEGNERLQTSQAKTYKDNPSEKTKVINEEKEKVRNQIKEIDGQIATVDSQISEAEGIVDQTRALSDYESNESLKTSVGEILEQLKGVKEVKRKLVTLRQETENKIKEIDDRWAKIDKDMGDVKNDNIGFALREVLNAHDPKNIISREELQVAVNAELNKRDEKNAIAERKKIEAEERKEDEEKAEVLDAFIKDARVAIENGKTDILARLENFKKRIEDKGSEGVKAKIADAFVKIPDLLAPKKIFGFASKGTHKDLTGAERVYDETKGLIESLEKDFGRLSADSILKTVSDIWNQNNKLPKIKIVDITIYYGINADPILKMFKTSDVIKIVQEKIGLLEGRFQAIVHDINLKRQEIHSKLMDSREGLLKHSTQNIEMLEELRRMWDLYR